jgi:alkyldihydroxyacetonephosphate synthase
VGLDVMRRAVQRGAHPAVLRLYDAAEADRTYGTGDRALLLALDEGDGTVIEATFELLAEECLRAGGHRSAEAHVEHWLAHRNEVAALEALTSKGYTVDTMEVTGSWADLSTIYRDTLDALLAVDGTIAASAHQSHSYQTGGCLYFTFAGQVEADRRDAYYRELWDAGQRTVLARGGALSHHHGVGLNRGRFMAEALGPAHQVLVAVKAGLDPHGILNPGKLGLPSPWAAPAGW